MSIYHHVHGHEQPDIDHLEVRGGGERGLDTGHDGGDHQHQSEAHHDPVLDNGIYFWSFYCLFYTVNSRQYVLIDDSL